MNRKIILPGAFLILVFQFRELVTAAPAPGLDLPRLTSEANLIVVGQVTSIREENHGRYEINGTQMVARRLSVTLRVDRTVKGETKAEVTFNYLSPDEAIGYRGIANDEFGMFFLRADAEGLSPVSPYY